MRYCGRSACTSDTHACGLEVVPVGNSQNAFLCYIPNREPAIALCIVTGFLFHICCWWFQCFNICWQQNRFRIPSCLLHGP